MYKGIIDQEKFSQKVNKAQSDFSKYKYPRTKEEYWNVVDTYWTPLLDILLQFGPRVIMLGGELKNLSVAATWLKENRESEIAEYFQKTWSSAPDNGHIHAIPAWHILCDLCSESYLLSDEEV